MSTTNPVRKYEGLFIFPPQEVPDALKQEEKRIEELLRRFGGRNFEHKDWGRRLLGFPLKKVKEGRFVVWNFEMEPGQLGEFQKALHLEETLLKATLVKPLVPKPVKEKVRRRVQHPREQVRERETHRETREGIRGRQS